MALFKILKGQSANLGNQDLHEGWAYFTEDTGEFYIDTSVKRWKIGGSNFYTLTSSVAKSSWSASKNTAGYYTVSISNPNYNFDDYNITLSEPSGLSVTEKADYIYAQINLLSASGNTVVIGANRKPTIDMIFNLLLLPTINSTIASGVIYTDDGNGNITINSWPAPTDDGNGNITI